MLDMRVCPDCGQKNRVGQHSENQRPKCGSCGGKLEPSKRVEPVPPARPVHQPNRQEFPNGKTLSWPDFELPRQNIPASSDTQIYKNEITKIQRHQKSIERQSEDYISGLRKTFEARLTEYNRLSAAAQNEKRQSAPMMWLYFAIGVGSLFTISIEFWLGVVGSGVGFFLANEQRKEGEKAAAAFLASQGMERPSDAHIYEHTKKLNDFRAKCRNRIKHLENEQAKERSRASNNQPSNQGQALSRSQNTAAELRSRVNALEGRQRQRAGSVKKHLLKAAKEQGNWVCPYCNKNKDLERAVGEHVIPVKHGGRNEGNMVLVCEPCNQAKGDDTLKQFIEKKGYNRDQVESRLRLLGVETI